MLQCSRTTSTKRLVCLANSHVGVCLLLCAIMAVFLWWNLHLLHICIPQNLALSIFSLESGVLGLVSMIMVFLWWNLESPYSPHLYSTKPCTLNFVSTSWCIGFGVHYHSVLSLSFLEKKGQLFSDGWMASIGICDSKVGILSWKNSRKLAVGCDGLCAWMQ